MVTMFGTRLRELRRNMKLQQDQVAKLIGVTKNAISTYENNARQPSLEILLRFANLYRVSTDYLLGRSDANTIDLSNLTAEDVAIVCDLVRTLSEKNERINDLLSR